MEKEKIKQRVERAVRRSMERVRSAGVELFFLPTPEDLQEALQAEGVEAEAWLEEKGLVVAGQSWAFRIGPEGKVEEA
ncbi:MAG: hypothetical protein ABDH20_01430 [Thermus sp.]